MCQQHAEAAIKMCVKGNDIVSFPEWCPYHLWKNREMNEAADKQYEPRTTTLQYVFNTF